jgi:hypothetical protein
MNQPREFQASADHSGASNESVVLTALEIAKNAARAGCTIMLVEGISDQAGIDALAKRRGRDFEKEGVITVAIGGATKISRFLDHQQNKPTTCGHLLHPILGPSKSRPFFTFWILQPIERLADGT